MSQRKSVRRRVVGRDKMGPVEVLRITYIDGRRTWGVSMPGMLALFGRDRQAANRLIKTFDPPTV